MAAFGQVGEHGINFINRHALRARLENRRKQQVFFARQAGENAPFFRAVAHAQVRNAVRWHVDGLHTIDLHRALAGAGEAHDSPHGGGATSAVAPEQGHDFAGPHHDVHAMQHM